MENLKKENMKKEVEKGKEVIDSYKKDEKEPLLTDNVIKFGLVALVASLVTGCVLIVYFKFIRSK